MSYSMTNDTISRCESTGIEIKWDGLVATHDEAGVRFEIAKGGDGWYYLTANGEQVSFGRDGISRNRHVNGARLDALEVLRHRLGLVRHS